MTNTLTQTVRTCTNSVPFLIIILSFGPLVLPAVGVRTEHLIIYGLVCPSICALLVERGLQRLEGGLLGIMSLFGSVTIWTICVTMLSDYNPAANGKILAHLENYLQPMAIILVILSFVKFSSLEEITKLFSRVCMLVIVLLCLNTFLAIATIFFDLYHFLNYFNAVDPEGSNVAIMSMSMGRFMGIYNMPIESGISYSLGLLC
ncbi:MAG: hypothetical protein K8F30_13620, partial [Taibaiella sp.]|nr:hypothetical protein [Taibaiella sp.]